MTFRNGFAAALVVGAVMVAGLGARGSDAPVMAEDAGDLVYQTVQGDFGDVTLAVEDAIVNRGLVVDYHGFLSKMLERTSEATGGATVLAQAEWFQFCSARLSQAMIAADPRNVGYCPYSIVVYELAASPGTIHVGYRRPGTAVSEASMKALSAVDTLLTEIVAEATR
ncbi:DUF302 domain-containing protein [Microbaculum sp. FT89]|uniref:DUF302 domain-containing protein n=1 Tax=Microbaculum sp. FT89 TaxID=3447298 RepID=UPI003F52FDB3